MAHTSTKTHPIDSGYAWIVLASCCFLRILLDGFWGSLGVLFVKWEVYFGSSSSETSLIGSIFMMNMCAMGPVSSALVNHLSYRSVVFGSGICSFICCFTLSFVTQFWHLYIIMSLLSISMGMSYTPAYGCFVSYFEKHAALAYMLVNSSAGIGLMIVPPLMEFLISQYSWQGALQISAPIVAHICICGLLLRPINSIPIKSRSEITKPSETDLSVKNRCFKFVYSLSADFDLTLFRNVRFIFQAIISGILLGTLSTYVITLVRYAVSIGISEFYASLLVLFYGVFMVASRLSPIGCLVDKKVLSASTFGGMALLFSGLMTVATSFMRTFKHLVPTCAIVGMCHGFGCPMALLVIGQSLEHKEKAKGAFAWWMIAYGSGCVFTLYMSGFLYDITGTYRYSLNLCGISLASAGTILLCDPLLIRWQSRLERHRDICSISSGRDAYKSLHLDIGKTTPV